MATTLRQLRSIEAQLGPAEAVLGKLEKQYKDVGARYGKDPTVTARDVNQINAQLIQQRDSVKTLKKERASLIRKIVSSQDVRASLAEDELALSRRPYYVNEYKPVKSVDFCSRGDIGCVKDADVKSYNDSVNTWNQWRTRVLTEQVINDADLKVIKGLLNPEQCHDQECLNFTTKFNAAQCQGYRTFEASLTGLADSAIADAKYHNDDYPYGLYCYGKDPTKYGKPL